MKHKLEPRLLGEISIISDMAESKELKSLLMKLKERRCWNPSAPLFHPQPLGPAVQSQEWGELQGLQQVRPRQQLASMPRYLLLFMFLIFLPEIPWILFQAVLEASPSSEGIGKSGVFNTEVPLENGPHTEF